MTRRFVVALAFAAMTALTSAPAKAQTDAPRPELSPEDELEFEVVEANASTASTLYTVGLTAHLVGLAVFGGGVGWALAEFCIGCGARDSTGSATLLVSGASLFFGGLVVLLTGVGFDADSGRRRDALRQRYPDLDLSLAPTDGGAFGSATLRF